jgi:hypothetical protein
MDLRGIFLGLQGKMIATLEAHRAAIDHTITKGTASELQWLEMLSKYLPERYRADSAFVLDSNGMISQQIDIVIYDRQYSPLLFDEDGARFVPAESVYAVIEVKSIMSHKEVPYAGEKAASVRRLHRSTAPIPHAGGQYPAKEPPRILAGIVALESRWNPAFGPPFVEALEALKPEERLDVGCALRDGGFDAHYPPDGPPQVHSGAPETALIFFFVKLLGRLQAMGTVPALDFEKYGRVL